MNLSEVSKSSMSLVQDFPSEYRSKIMKMALLSFSPTGQDHAKFIDDFSKVSNIPKEHIYEVLGVYIGIIRLLMENNDAEFSHKLTEIGFSNDFLGKLSFTENREEIVNNLMTKKTTDFGKLSSIKWRIDISLSNSALMKKIPANVVFSITLKNKKKYIMEVEAREFHKLRFNVALLLKEMSLLKSIK
ncbi:unnamed protein product [Phaedon cochleariae]|uniref:COMM domain-containing protein 5 n=1 Tax=Phaedon cochleariae TaxID=80249 RepID=A0A9N9SET0_PHACE|nr:unnamed protein product [Phaedon cochleariae]